MKTTLIAMLALAAVSSGAETAKLVASVAGHEVGSVVYDTEIKPDGTWSESFVSKLAINGAELVSSTKVQFSADGRALEDDEKETLNGETREDIVIKFEPGKATVTDKVSGQTKALDAPKDPPTLDASDSWFAKTKPKIGDKAVASSFSAEQGWHTTTVTYVSDKPFKLGDKTVTGHLLRHDHPTDSYEEIVDDHGLPLQVDLSGPNGLHFVRTPYTDL